MMESPVTLTTLTGLAAASCTTIAFFPQVLKAWRSRSTKDISLGMFLLLVAGIVLWLVYGTVKGDLPLILANVVTLCLAAAILVLKLRFG
jgi:MtN3 and saliva related transmembrane protein